MSATRTASERIADEVGSWPGVEIDDGELGELAFKYGRRELGHLHGDHAAHFSFPRATWRELRDAGRIDFHPVFPGKSGPGQRRIETDADVADVVELFRINYDRGVERERREERPGA
jgi:Luciferase